jgi:hypothetical protein
VAAGHGHDKSKPLQFDRSKGHSGWSICVTHAVPLSTGIATHSSSAHSPCLHSTSRNLFRHPNSSHCGAPTLAPASSNTRRVRRKNILPRFCLGSLFGFSDFFDFFQFCFTNAKRVEITSQVVLMPLHMGSTALRQGRQRRTRSRLRPSPTAARRHSPYRPPPHSLCRTAAQHRIRRARAGLPHRTREPPAPWCRRQSVARARNAAPRYRLLRAQRRQHTRMSLSVAAPVRATSSDSQSTVRRWRQSMPVHAQTASRRCCCC